MQKHIIPLLVVSSAPLYSAVILNENFDSATYDEGFFNGADSGSNPDDLSYINTSIEPTGGNPGNYLRIEHVHELERDSPSGFDTQTSVQSFFTLTNFIYDASTSGPLETLTFSLDVFFTSLPSYTIFFEVSDPAGGSFAGFQTIPQATGWDTVTISGLTAADFAPRDFTGGTDLSFGFGFITSLDVADTDETLIFQVDNFVVESNPVPEPSASMFCLCLALPLLRRKR